jgi:oxygen-independent coproporphyrinogen-3 oxidase
MSSTHQTTEEDVEITLEMDPGTFDLTRLEHLLSLHIMNRVSVGIQSFDETILTKLGRAHSLQDSYRAIEALQAVSPLVLGSHSASSSLASSSYPLLSHGFNLDLISGLPYLTESIWKHSLETALLHSGCHHISVYDLQIESKTAFGSWGYQSGLFPLPCEEIATNMYKLAVDMLTTNPCDNLNLKGKEHILTIPGFEHYEISNYARLDTHSSTSTRSRYQSRHNSKYWKCIPYLAIGVGATSYIGNKRFCRPTKMKDYIQWLDDSERNRQHFADEIGVSSMTIEHERDESLLPDILDVVMCGLRTSEGLHLDQVSQWYGEDAVQKILTSLSTLIDDGLVVIEKDSHSHRRSMRLKDPDGFLISNTIISNVFAGLSDKKS